MSEAKQVSMTPVVGVRFGHDCRISYCDPQELALEEGGRVVVQTPRGEKLGTVVASPRWWPEEVVAGRLWPVLRVADAGDEHREEEEREQLQLARACAQEQITSLGLSMRLVDAEMAADRSRLTFYFVAEGRVDFRELVHQLAERLHTRVELRQIGARDHARMLGGLGPCGRPLCCAAFLQEFAPVSIRMAKEQNIALNPGRISGMCGRLMCCLRYEEDPAGANGRANEPAATPDSARPDEERGPEISEPCAHCPRLTPEQAEPEVADVAQQPRSRRARRTRRGAAGAGDKPIVKSEPIRRPEGPNVA